MVLQLNKHLGKPKADGVNPFILFAKSKTVERGDAPITVTVFVECRGVLVLYHAPLIGQNTFV